MSTYLSDFPLLVIGSNIFGSRLEMMFKLLVITKIINDESEAKQPGTACLRVEEREAPALLSDPRVVRELRLWLNLYSRLELPSRVLCLTILLLREPSVETVPSVDMSGLEEGFLSPWAHRGRSLIVLLLARE